MEISILYIILIKPGGYGFSIYPVWSNRAIPLGLKGSSGFKDKRRNQLLTSFDHKDKSIVVSLHVVYVFLAEISAIKDETDIFVTIFFYLIDHVFELWNIRDGAGIFLIEKRNTVCFVKGQSYIEDRQPFFILGFAVLNDINIACITVFVGRIIWDVDALLMITFFVPIVEKSKDLIFGYRFQKPTDLGIAVYPHPIGKERMIESKIRIVLAGIFFFNNQVEYEIL